MSTPFVTLHRVRIDEVDAAGVVFFARYFGWCHEAMAAMFEALEGGYAGLLTSRGIGLPTVHAEADYFAPLRFGHTASIAVTTEKVGRSSCTLAFAVDRPADSTRVASIRHIVAAVDLAAMKARPLPEDMRRVFEKYAVARPR